MRAFLVLLFVISACPPGKEKPAESKACAKVGQSCEIAPGKLGSCVQKDNCTGAVGSGAGARSEGGARSPSAACFVCQSQH